MSEVLLISLSEGILTLTLNRPNHLNALTPTVMEELAQACVVAADASVRVVVLTGAGRAFCSGVDRSIIDGAGPGGGNRLRSQYHAVMATLGALEKPLIAAVNGPAAGAGLALAAAADIRICADNASFVGGFLAAGLAPDNGASYHLVRLLGYAGSFELLGLEPWSAEKALARGLVTRVVPSDLVVTSAHEVARQFASHPLGALAATKHLLRCASHSNLVTQLEAEASAYDTTSSDEECRSRRRAFIRG